MPSKQQFRNFISHSTSGAAMIALVLAIGFDLLVVANQPAQGQTFTVLHNFADGSDGAYPSNGLTMDAAGNLYGTTLGCDGLPSCDTVFKLSHQGAGWVINTLRSFKEGSVNGFFLEGGLAIAQDGTLFGTTVRGAS